MKHALSILLVLLSTSLSAREIRITHIEIEGPSSLPGNQILSLIRLKEGDAFNEKRLEQSLDYLKKWGRFSEVQVDKKMTADGLSLTLRLKEGLLINAIRISGNYPYLSRSLHRKLSIRRGNFYVPQVANEQIKRLEDFYEREGYFGTEVSLHVRHDSKDGNVTLHYQIKKGDLYRLNRIEIEGGPLFPRGYFISQLNPLLPYRPERLRNSLNKIRKDYRKKGYLQTRLRIEEFKIDHERRKIDLKVSVQESPHVKVVFLGNKRIKRKTLKKITPVLTEGDTSSLAIEESTRAIHNFYKKHGFLKPSVTARKTRLDPSHLLIHFNIQEGTQSRVKKIRLSGAGELRPRKIKRDLATKEASLFQEGYYDPETVESDFQKLPEIYRRRGFFETHALDQETRFSRLGDKATVIFSIDEGRIRRIGRIRFEGNQKIPTEKLHRLLKMKEGDLPAQEDLKNDQNALQNYYSDRGYIYAAIESSLHEEGETMNLVYKIDEGPQVRVGEILIIGNHLTWPSAIKKALDLKPGRPFSLKKLLKSEAALRRTGAFRSVDIEPLGIAEREEKIPVLVKLEENPRLYIDLESSFDTDNKFTGATSLQHNNLLGFAKRSTLRLTGGNDIQKGELNFIDPLFLGFNLEMVTTGLVEAEQRPSFAAIDAGGKLTFRSPLTDQMTLLSKYELTRTLFQNVADPTAAALRDHTISEVGISFNYDTRDSFADPKKGINALAGLDFSNKILGSGFNFLQPVASFTHYTLFASRFTLLNYVRAQGIEVFGAETLPRDKRLFLGGDYSVRGFSQDSLGPRDAAGALTGGLLLFLHTVEIQTKIKGELKFAGFLDSGSVTNRFSELDLNSLRHSAGGGIRYITPIGPLRLDYGVKLDRQPGEGLSRLHFAFGYAF